MVAIMQLQKNFLQKVFFVYVFFCSVSTKGPIGKKSLALENAWCRHVLCTDVDKTKSWDYTDGSWYVIWEENQPEQLG